MTEFLDILQLLVLIWVLVEVRKSKKLISPSSKDCLTPSAGISTGEDRVNFDFATGKQWFS